jgi:phosphatidylinositol glycan class B
MKFIATWADHSGLKDRDWVKFLTQWLLFSLILHLIAGFLSVGFYDMDEHFQIMEFLSYKLGRTPVSHLAPEFLERSRSWMQPTLYEGLARLCILFGVHSPNTWATVIRLFSSLLGWLSLVGISLCAYHWMETPFYRRLTVMFASLLYFFPYLHSRTSSESLSGSFFFIAVAIFQLSSFPKNQKKDASSLSLKNLDSSVKLPLSLRSDLHRGLPLDLHWLTAFGIGLLLGLSFLCRFQAGFMIAGFGAWCLFLGRAPFTKLLSMLIGILSIIALGVLADYRGYGVWTLSAYNYFSIALLHGKAASTGVSPWWYYFQFLQGDVPLIGLLLAAGVILGWIVRPLHVITFSTAPFFIVHMMLAHKEPRYLFPLISGVPILLAYGYEGASKIWNQFKPHSTRLQRYIKAPYRLGLGIILTLNMGGLIVATFKPTAVQPLLHGYLFDHQNELSTLYYLGRDPFELISLQVDFYKPLGLQAIPAQSFDSFADTLKGSKTPLWLYYTHFDLPPEAKDLTQKCQLKYSVFPNWLKHFLFLPGIRLSSNKGSIFQCDPR